MMKSDVYNSAWEAERKDGLNSEFQHEGSDEGHEDEDNDNYKKFLEEEEKKKRMFMKQLGEDQDEEEFGHQGEGEAE